MALNAAGIGSPGGSTWSPQAVKNVLRHPLYRGEYQHGASRTVARGGTLVRVRAPDAEVLRVPHPELRIWPDALLAKIDAALAQSRRGGWGAAAPRHLGSSFLRCGVCCASLVVSGTKKRNNLSYVCDRHRLHGSFACRGIGYRAERAVDRALLGAVAPFIDGDIAERAIALLTAELKAQARGDGRETARERAQRDLDAAQRKAKNLTDAIARGDEMDALLVALREQTDRIAALKAELDRLKHARPVAMDPRRTRIVGTGGRFWGTPMSGSTRPLRIGPPRSSIGRDGGGIVRRQGNAFGRSGRSSPRRWSIGSSDRRTESRRPFPGASEGRVPWRARTVSSRKGDVSRRGRPIRSPR